MEICDWGSMTKDEFLIHLFAKSADMTMSKISMEILSGKNPTVAELRNKIVENLLEEQLEVLELGDQEVDKLLRGDFVNLAIVLVTGNPNASEYALIVSSVDISLNGVVMLQERICHLYLQ